MCVPACVRALCLPVCVTMSLYALPLIPVSPLPLSPSFSISVSQYVSLCLYMPSLLSQSPPSHSLLLSLFLSPNMCRYVSICPPSYPSLPPPTLSFFLYFCLPICVTMSLYALTLIPVSPLPLSPFSISVSQYVSLCLYMPSLLSQSPPSHSLLLSLFLSPNMCHYVSICPPSSPSLFHPTLSRFLYLCLPVCVTMSITMPSLLSQSPPSHSLPLSLSLSPCMCHYVSTCPPSSPSLPHSTLSRFLYLCLPVCVTMSLHALPQVPVFPIPLSPAFSISVSLYVSLCL